MVNNNRIKAKAIIFDKDGTLIDFDAFWVTLSRAALKELLKSLIRNEGLSEEILEAFGVHNGVTDINSVLCKGTYAQMAQIVYAILQQHQYEISPEKVEQMLIDAYNKNSYIGEVKATCSNLRKVLISLRNKNKKLAVITTDNKEMTQFCLKKLDVMDLFDFIYTDDGIIPTKPNPDSALHFCNLTGLNKEDIVMVGDTMTDINFAQNAGIKVIGVAKTEANKKILSENADVVIHDVSELLKILE